MSEPGNNKPAQAEKARHARAGSRLRESRLTPEEQVEIARRVEAGEGMADIGRELDYTRQRISAIYKKYRERGEQGMAHRKRGPKGEKLTDEQKEKLRKMLLEMKPSDFGFAKKSTWTLEKAMAASSRVIGRPAGKRNTRTAFKEANLELGFDVDPDEDLYTPEFKAWLKSEKAKEIREREEAYRRRLEAEGHVRPKRRGRPTKEESAARAAQPWKLEAYSKDAEGKDKESAGEEGAAAHVKDEVEGDDDYHIPDWNNMGEEEFKAMRKDLKAGGRLPPSPGTRVGKHRKGSAHQKPKRRKKKKKGGKR